MTKMFPQQESILSLCKKLNLQPPGEFEQDWEYMAADPHRINDFLLLYKNDKDLSENEKFTLGILIIGSLNDALDIGMFSEDVWDACWETLKKIYPCTQAHLTIGHIGRKRILRIVFLFLKDCDL